MIGAKIWETHCNSYEFSIKDTIFSSNDYHIIVCLLIRCQLPIANKK